MKAAQPSFKPTFAVLGKIKSIGKPGPSKNEASDLTVAKIEIDAKGGSSPRGIVNYYFCFKPEWFDPEFEPGDNFVYFKNLYNTVGSAFLQCAAGEDFDELDQAVGELHAAGYDDADFQRLLQRFLEDKPVLFELEQERTKTEQINPETGKNIWVRTENYNLSKFHPIDERGKVLGNLELRAAKAEQRALEAGDGRQPSFKVAWEVERAENETEATTVSA